MGIILQSTQPAVSDWLSPDKLAALLVALTGLVTAIVALMRASANKGTLEQVTTRQEAQSQTARQLRSDLTQVALQTPTMGTGNGGAAEAERMSDVARLPGLINPYTTYPSDRPKDQL